MAEPLLMIQMPVTELQRLIREAVKAEIKEEFEPLRKQFEDRFMGINEVCEKLGVTRMTLHNLEKKRRIDAYKNRIKCTIQRECNYNILKRAVCLYQVTRENTCIYYKRVMFLFSRYEHRILHTCHYCVMVVIYEFLYI